MQLVELHRLLPAERKTDTVIVAISPDTPEKISDIVPKVKSKSGVDFEITLLSDAKHEVIDRYGLRNAVAAASGRFLPHPTTYVIDKDGTIRWKFTEKDYKIRPTNEMVLNELKKLR